MAYGRQSRRPIFRENFTGEFAMRKVAFEYAEDPIPEKAIRLSEVYESVRKAITANPKILDTIGEELLRDLRENKKTDETIINWDTYSEADKRDIDGRRRRQYFFVTSCAKVNC
jgi:hypothetical protein